MNYNERFLSTSYCQRSAEIGSSLGRLGTQQAGGRDRTSGEAMTAVGPQLPIDTCLIILASLIDSRFV